MIQTHGNMVEVFKTNVTNPQQADELICLLRTILPGSRINFDLEDCDKVLRIDYESVDPAHVTGILAGRGFECCVMQ
ncbi:MAG: hypothetical protein H3C54_15155 [Taibaiella sp.]|nr:hypothetical protein [Taibaiella sp.]